ncbi:hypothetical protein [Litorivivens sp.]|uniref:hypothetical protein n=1 Tax=Litorivivens sp. TaxID=2020868 RepID=UPI003561B605
MKQLTILLLALIAIASHAQQVVEYRYDDAGRLIVANYGTKEIRYEYDASGNLLSRRVQNPQQEPGNGGDVVTEPSTPPGQVKSRPGDKNLTLAAFVVENTESDSVVLDTVTVTISGGRAGAITALRLVSDSNSNQSADVGEPILAREGHIPEDCIVRFSLAQPITLAAGESRRFVVVTDF